MDGSHSQAAHSTHSSAAQQLLSLSEPAADRRGIGKIQTLLLILSRQKIF
eukprot:COSAG05_NODE_126_length_17260_cov_8.550434_1_plen_50_part_00